MPCDHFISPTKSIEELVLLILALSAPIHAYLSLTGFSNMLSQKVDLSGFNRNFLARFTGPMRMRLWLLPLSCITKPFRVVVAGKFFFFNWSSSLAFLRNCTWQLGTCYVLSLSSTLPILNYLLALSFSLAESLCRTKNMGKPSKWFKK